MPEYLRVKDKSTGHKLSIIASAMDEEAYTVLKQDAIDPTTGDPLGPEYAGDTASSSAPARKDAARPAAKKAAAKKATAKKAAASQTSDGQAATAQKENS